MSYVIAKGRDVFTQMLKFTPYPYKSVRPLTVLPEGKKDKILFVTYEPIYALFYRQKDDTLRSEFHVEFDRRMQIGHYIKGLTSASWSVPVYKTMVYFSLALVPAGRVAKHGVNCISVATFWANHSLEIKACMATIFEIVTHLRALYSVYPTLSYLMVCVALQRGTIKVKAEREKKGLWSLVTSTLDFEKSAYDIADFLGSLLKHKMFPTDSFPAKWLARRGLQRLSRVVGELHGFYKAYGLLVKGKNALAPKINDSHLLVAQLVKMFGQAGVTITPQDSARIAEEIHKNPKDMERLQALSAACTELEKRLSILTAAAKNEIFLPV